MGAAESDNFNRFVRILANTEIWKHCTIFHDHLLQTVLNTLYIRGFSWIIYSKMDNSSFHVEALLCRHWNEIWVREKHFEIVMRNFAAIFFLFNHPFLAKLKIWIFNTGLKWVLQYIISIDNGIDTWISFLAQHVYNFNLNF